MALRAPVWGALWEGVRGLARHWVGRPGRVDDPESLALAQRAAAARAAGDREEARALYRQCLVRHRGDLAAHEALALLAAEAGDWGEAVEHQERVVALVAAARRPDAERELAAYACQAGGADLAAGRRARGIARLREALRLSPEFVPAALALGDALDAAGDTREALRVWERALDRVPALPLLARLRARLRADGQPGRLVALHQELVRRHPDNLLLALELGRVYLELAMLGEAADQLERLEVRAPRAAAVQALLGAVFERRDETAEALAAYRRALELTGEAAWPHRCDACGRTTVSSATSRAGGWAPRCDGCGRWNTLAPSPAD